MCTILLTHVVTVPNGHYAYGFVFQMQEHIVTLEDNVRDSRVKLKQAEDSLKMESENQSQMTYR